MPPLAGQIGENGQQVNLLLGAMCRPRAEEGILGQDNITLGSIEGDQPVNMGEHALVLDGTIYNCRELEMLYGIAGVSDAELILHAVVHRGGGPQALVEVLREVDGDFALVYYDGKKLVLARDMVGMRPLFYSTRPFSFASERKALWAIDIKDTTRIPPGSMIAVDDRVESSKVLEISPRASIDDEEQAVEVLGKALQEAVEKRREGAAVAFSGGLDSSLIAYHAEAVLYTVGLEGSHDLQQARHAAAALGMELWTRELSESEVERYLPLVIEAIETTDVMQVSIALPLYATAEAVAEDGYRVLLTGQGADELFGGYKRYEEMSPQKQTEAIQRDVSEIGEKNLERDYMAAGAWGVDLRAPCLDRDVLGIGLSLSPDLRVRPSGKAYIRKYVLRVLADRLLPREIAWKEKKAMQYGTGVMAAIDRLARRQGFSRAEGRYMERYLQWIKENQS